MSFLLKLVDGFLMGIGLTLGYKFTVLLLGLFQRG